MITNYNSIQSGEALNELEITKVFRKNHFRATHQRIAVYKYLSENRTHPDADEIYKSVVATNPSFSKTTVYNSLQSLTEHGLIAKVNIDSDRVRYDISVGLHGHFICDCCGQIYDFDVDGIVHNSLDCFDINKKDIYFSGLCPKCKNK